MQITESTHAGNQTSIGAYGPADHAEERDIAAQWSALGEDSRRQFERVFEAMVEQLFGVGQAAREAIEAGSFAYEGATAVVRLDPHSYMVEFFYDAGQPHPHFESEDFRKLLQFNLCRAYPGIIFGVHPESGRMVATSSMPIFALTDAQIGLLLLEDLHGAVRDALEQGGIVVS